MSKDRHDIDLTVRKGEDRKTDDRFYRQQAIVKRRVQEAKTSAWEKMLAKNPKHAESEARAQEAKAGLQKANADYQAILDKEAAKKKTNEDFERMMEGQRGLWDNIHAKQDRIKHGSGEHMRKPGSKGAPTAAALKASQNEETGGTPLTPKEDHTAGGI